MGRLILLLLLIAAAYLIWKAFGPQTWSSRKQLEPEKPIIKGPDDDEDFLWELEKKRFKEQRAREEAAREEQERIKKTKKKYLSQENQEEIS
ncbi:hypothetical protein ACFLIN_05975 [Corynebacterium kutscheri]|uniref:hypothetical protein n=1 Tax=Corynebacterium kutscheri TaxID=35755 RepID=UPI0037BFEC18